MRFQDDWPLHGGLPTKAARRGGVHAPREQQQGGPVHAVNAAGAVHSAIPEPPAFENPPLTENPHVAAAGQAVETPTYMRNNNNPSAQGEMSADNLDIPTFLRRKMNA